MAEQLICNQQVVGSTPITSSKTEPQFGLIFGGFPERPKGADCKSVVTDFGGPNPPSPTRKKHLRKQVLFSVIFACGELYCFAVIFGLRRVIFALRVLEANIISL